MKNFNLITKRSLTDVFNMRNGYTPSRNNSNFWENGTIPWFRMDDIRENGHVLTDSIEHITPEAVKGNLFKSNSIIVATSATIGEHALLLSESLSNQRFTNLEIKEEYNDLIDSKYAYYYLFKLDQWCLNNVNKSSFASVDMNRFKKFPFIFPILEEQKKIVQILDTFTDLIDTLKSELALREKQFEYYLNKIFSSLDSSKFQMIQEIGSLKRAKGLRKDDFINQGVGCIHYGQIYTQLDIYTTDVLSHIPENKVINNSIVKPGEIIIASTGETREDVGKSVAWLGAEKIVTGDNAMILTHNLNPKFLAYYLQSQRFQKQKFKATKGTNLFIIDPKKYTKILVPILSKAQQSEIVSTLDSFFNLIKYLKQEIELRQKQYEYYRDKLLDFSEETK